MIEKVGRLPAHWPLCLVQAMDLHDDDCALFNFTWFDGRSFLHAFQ